MEKRDQGRGQDIGNEERRSLVEGGNIHQDRVTVRCGISVVTSVCLNLLRKKTDLWGLVFIVLVRCAALMTTPTAVLTSHYLNY